MEEPLHALAAPSHPDPYPWYADLRQRRPLFADERIGLWVVSGAALVQEALALPQLRVRPPAEPVPRALLGTAAGEVFSLLVRMNDGEFHARHKPDVAKAAGAWNDAAVAAAAAAAARNLVGRMDANALLAALPVQAMARLLDVPEPALADTVQWVQDFTAGIAAGATPAAVSQADLAARALMAQGEAAGRSRVAAANRIALMQQALDATAGLIGNAARAMSTAGAASCDLAFVANVARMDPAIHNTRRFAACDFDWQGQRIAAGAGLLLVLVDPAAPAPPGFGGGAHACPGERIALVMATAALQELSAAAPLSRLFGPVGGYRPLPNARIPVFRQPA